MTAEHTDSSIASIAARIFLSCRADDRELHPQPVAGCHASSIATTPGADARGELKTAAVGFRGSSRADLAAESEPGAGLVNQGWKDSVDGTTFADGRVADAPLAVAEVQGYTYAAYRARAHLADAFSDPATSRRCAERATALRRRFDERFWLPDRGWFALALDADKKPVDALASNMGHCLWSGIVGADRAAAVAAHLLSPAMFSGWGIRTLASSMGAYDPMSYHNGSVWPHDNALCVAGLVRYGFDREARRVAAGLLAASPVFGHRLPELFGGYDRTETGRPVPYPTSCSPRRGRPPRP